MTILALIAFILACLLALLNQQLGPVGWPELTAAGLALTVAAGWRRT